MRLIWTAVLVLVCAGTAQANPITGDYGDAGGCARLTGALPTGDMVFILTPDRIDRYETSCDISTIQTMDGAPVVLEVSCSGEGEFWTDSYAISPLTGEDGYLIGPLDAPDIRFELRRCE